MVECIFSDFIFYSRLYYYEVCSGENVSSVIHVRVDLVVMHRSYDAPYRSVWSYNCSLIYAANSTLYMCHDKERLIIID